MVDYLFDLEQTYSLNVELFQNILCESFKNKEKQELLKTLDRIKLLKERKRKLIDDILKTRGKILVDKQIYEEAKRIHEENDNFQQEQEEEIKELVENKFCSIKELEKKFQEVDIYMKKHYPNVYSYEILKIVEINENLTNKKSKINNNIEAVKKNMSLLLNENIGMLKKGKENINEILIKTDSKPEEKFDIMIKLYEGKIITLQKIKDQLISLKQGIGSDKPVKITKRNDNVNLSVIGKRAINRGDTMNLNVSNYDDLVNKMPSKNAFFEQTIILKDFNNDTTQFGYLNKTSDLGNKGDQIWDLSVIKKD